jgi:predicted kinase
MPLVIDNTNITRDIRLRYIDIFKNMNYKVKGYYFKTDIKQSLEWNNKRNEKEKIPEIGIIGFYKRLELPSIEEGFDELYYVETINNKFVVKEWKNEI